QTDELKSKRNQVSAQIPKMKKAGEDTTQVLAEMKRVSDQITEYDLKLKNVEEELNSILMYIPNLPHTSVPVGKTAAENVEVRQWLPDSFSFENSETPADHI